MRTAIGATERQDGNLKSAETGSRQVPRFGFHRRMLLEPGLCGSSPMFAVMALQNQFAVLDLGSLIFLFDPRRGRRSHRPCASNGNKQGRRLEVEESDGGQYRCAAKLSHVALH